MIGRVKGAALLAVLAAGALTLAACGRSDDGASGGKELRVWHYEAPGSAMGVAWNEAIKEFETTHPGVKVKLEEKGFEQIQKTAPMILNSSSAPDVMEYNKGNATTGLLSKQGLLTDLSDEAAERGWDREVGPAAGVTSRYDERGVMGSGKWYGVPNYAEYVTIYYNKTMFDQRGLAAPTTLEGLTAAMAEFAAEGVTPLALGGAEYPAAQLLYQLALTRADRDWVDRFQRYTGKVDFHDRTWSHAVETFAAWLREGYLDEDSAGLKAEDMGLSFIQGRHPIMISGSWWYGRLRSQVRDFEWATAPWPGMTAGSGGNLWVVPAGAKNKELAYDFIEITLSQPVQDLLRDSGGVALAPGDAPPADPGVAALNEGFRELSAADRLAFYPDWPVPGFYDAQVSSVQKLITGELGPHEVLTELADYYEENLAGVGG